MGARDTGPEGLPASCEARSRDGDRGLSLQARWGSRDETTTAFLDRTGLSAYSAPLSPLGSWPGVLMGDPGRTSVSLWLKCDNKKDESLTVDAVSNRGASANAGLSSAGRKQFAAAAVASAKRAADKAGCEYTGKGSLAGLAGSPRNDPAGISRAPGTCAGLRPLAPRAGRLGLSHVWAPRASASAPVEDCVLTTSKDPQLPGYWMSAHFGPYAKDLTKRFAQRVSGERGREKDGSLVWATASCPGAGTRALFLLRGITDNDTRTGTGKVPVKRDSPAFRADALSAFARQSAERHDCGDLKLP